MVVQAPRMMSSVDDGPALPLASVEEFSCESESDCEWHDSLVDQLLEDSVRCIASARAFGKVPSACGVAVRSIDEVHLGDAQRAYRTMFAFGTAGASVVQLLRRDGLALAADAQTLSPEGEHFVFNEAGTLKCWTRPALGTNRLYVVHDEGAVLSMRLTVWPVVRGALLSGNIRDLIVTPNDSRRGDLRYSEAHRVWARYSLSSGRWLAHAAPAQPQPVRSPHEMYARA